MNNSKILVTGGAGYIGSHFINFLVKKKNIKPGNILVIDNLKYGHKEALPKGVIIKKLDLTQDLKEVTDFKPQVTFHFASYALVGESMKKPRKYLGDNVLGSVNLLKALQKANCKHIIFSSSCSVYGIPDKTPISEGESLKPINPYGESKMIIEKILDQYDKLFGIKYTSLRYFNAAGADFGIGESHKPETHLIPIIMEVILGNRDELKIFGTDYSTSDGTCIRDYIHVTDLARAHYLAWKKLETSNQSLILNLGTGRGTSIKEIVEKCKKLTSERFKVIESERRQGDPAELVADPTKAQNELKWKTKRNIDDILLSAWDWHKNRKF